MRILHSADWHLGQHFFGKTRQAEHQALIQWLITQVQTHHIDAVILAGDIFDTGTPPSYARELYFDLIARLNQHQTQLFILGGNHDSVATLNESRSLLANFKTTVIASTDLPLEQQVYTLNQADGTVGAIICTIPFIRARDVLISQADQSEEDKQKSLQIAISNHYQKLYQLALTKRDALSYPVPIIMTGHLTTVGACASESVRDIYIGSLEAFPTNQFPPADYIALGHIHRPQKVGGLNHIRYSGSPIPLSFDELKYQKEMLMLDFDGTGLHQIMPLPLPRFQPMLSVQCQLNELKAEVETYIKQHGTPCQPIWLEVIIETDDYLSDLQSHVQTSLEGLPIEILRVRRNRQASAQLTSGDDNITLEELSPIEVFQERLKQEMLDEVTQNQLNQRFQQVIEQLQDDLA